NLIYHYTDAKGLEGILREGCLRATHVKYLNDHSELDYGMKLFKEVVGEKRKSVTEWKEGKTILSGSLKPTSDAYYILDEVLARLENRFYGVDFYSTSFCVDGNLLSQWRAYGSRKTSFSIGFDRETLLSKITGTKPELRNIEYELKNQKKEIATIIDKEVSSFKSKVKTEGLSPIESSEEPRTAKLIREHGNELERELFRVALLYKNDFFKEEQEYRLWEAHYNWQPEHFEPIEFDVSVGELRPYVNMRIIDDNNREKMIQRIYALSPNYDLTKKSLQLLLRKHGYDTDNTEDVDIKRSGIPIRF
ncbi:MAG: DUF2971 domain-containing protein, partial [Deltaproteobacteria bacterium]|nr:DUF2971 domain-containing protein [Deltaproteobacteria bacterium]